jgi:hypothetical protein
MKGLRESHPKSKAKTKTFKINNKLVYKTVKEFFKNNMLTRGSMSSKRRYLIRYK